MIKFLLNCVVNIKDFLCFNFQVLTNLFDMFLKMIPNAIYNISLVSTFVDLLVPLFVVL